MKTWGDIYHQHLRKGEDHGWAAHCADEYMRRKGFDLCHRHNFYPKGQACPDCAREENKAEAEEGTDG